MADQKPVTKKAATKKTAGIKKAAPKKASIKKAAPKKTTVSKKAAIKKSASAKPTSKTVTPKVVPKDSNASNKDVLTTIQSIVNEMRDENKNRDLQITALVKEVREGFLSNTNFSSEQISARNEEMEKLYQSLQSTFSNVKEKSDEQEERSLLILKSLTNSIMKDHEQTLKEVQEHEKLQDKKFKHLTKVEEHRAGRNRWIAIPGMIIAIIAIIYMFYVVNIMETAMTSMSKDMTRMQTAVGNMSQRVGSMSIDTHSMNGSMLLLNENVGKMSQDTNQMSSNMVQLSEDTTAMNGGMQQLNTNIGVMSQDLNVMTRNVAPTMKGMRDMMPWSP